MCRLIVLLSATVLLAATGTCAEIFKSSVNGGSLVSSWSNVTSDTDNSTSDVLQSLLYAQLNVTQYFSKYYDTANWYLAYVSGLRQLGWTLNTPSWLPSNGKVETWRSMVEKALFPYLGQEVAQQLEKTVVNFMKLPTSAEAVKVFREYSVAGDISNFQVVSMIKSDRAVLQTVIGLFKSISLEQQDQESKKTIAALVAVTQGNLNSTVYSNFRQHVKLALLKLPKITVNF